MPPDAQIVRPDETVLVTGAAGFIGLKLVEKLVEAGFRNIRCLVRPTRHAGAIDRIIRMLPPGSRIEIFRGNLLSREDCVRAAAGAAVIYHLAATPEKSFSGSVLNNVVTTRNLLDGAVRSGTLKRFVNVSSFAVYSNFELKAGSVLDESCPLESSAMERYDAYSYAKVLQEEIVREYRRKHGVPFVTLRPGVVYGPGTASLSGRVGVDTFGLYLHVGGGNLMPLVYVDNCADAILLAGIKDGVEGETYNVVDDELCTCREFLRNYKKNRGRFRSVYIPYPVFYALSYLWERYSYWSRFQLQPAFNRRKCAFQFKGNLYSNEKIKKGLGWRPRVGAAEASERYFGYLRTLEEKA